MLLNPLKIKMKALDWLPENFIQGIFIWRRSFLQICIATLAALIYTTGFQVQLLDSLK